MSTVVWDATAFTRRQSGYWGRLGVTPRGHVRIASIAGIALGGKAYSRILRVLLHVTVATYTTCTCAAHVRCSTS